MLYDTVRLQIVSKAKLMCKLTEKLIMFFRLKSMYKGLNNVNVDYPFISKVLAEKVTCEKVR